MSFRCSKLLILISLLFALMAILGPLSVNCDEDGENNNSVRTNDGDAENGVAEADKGQQHVPEDGQDAKYCGIHSNGFEPLHALMDQICELCHDFFSHYKPNTRVECRADCFRTITFKKCLRLFKPSRARRQLMGFLMVE